MGKTYAPTLSLPFNEIIGELNKIPVVPLMRPSGSTRDEHLELFLKNNGLGIFDRSKIPDAYFNLITDFLNHNIK